MSSPDLASFGLIDAAPAPLRYGSNDADADPIEVFGRLKSFMPSGVRVLDVGCGAGGGTIAMNKGKNNKIVGLEPDVARSEAARGRGLDCRTALFDINSVSQLGTFDVVVFADVLEHLVSPGAALMVARSVLHPNGSILISVPNIAHWSIRTKLLLGEFDYTSDGQMDATHLRWFTYNSLRKMLQRCGFRVQAEAGTAGVWLPCYPEIRGRRYVIRGLQSLMPGAFSCQLIVKAVMADS